MTFRGILWEELERPQKVCTKTNNYFVRRVENICFIVSMKQMNNLLEQTIQFHDMLCLMFAISIWPVMHNVS